MTASRPVTESGDDGTRTHDPLLAKQVLYQLSYIPLLQVLLELCISHKAAKRISPNESSDTLGFTSILVLIDQNRQTYRGSSQYKMTP